MAMWVAAQLDQAVKAVCPIDGVSIGRPDDKTTWRIDFRPEATKAQQQAAQTVVDTFVPVEDVDTRAIAKQKIQDYLDGTITARDAIAAIKDAL